MRVNLVTGGSGFLGSRLAEALLARGDKVRVLVRPTSQSDYLKSLGVELTCGDLKDLQSLESATQDIEYVYHCAALAADWGSPESFQAANVTGVRNLLEASVKAGVKKFIHISTTDVYGYPDYPADETAPYKYRGWPYGDTKIESEKLVWDYYSKYNLPVTIIRPVNIYGPRSVSFVLDIVELLKEGSMGYILVKEQNPQDWHMSLMLLMRYFLQQIRKSVLGRHIMFPMVRI